MYAFALVTQLLTAVPGTLAVAWAVSGAIAVAFGDWVPRTLGLGPVLVPPADLLRLVAVPVLGWAAVRDVRTRRVPNRTWTPLVAIALLALALDAAVVSGDSAFVQRLFVVQVGMSLVIVGGLAYAFWWIGGFGGADAKALMTLSLLYPTYPAVIVRGSDLVIPVAESTLGVFSLTILTNTVVIGVVAPVLLAARNAVRGRFTPAMFIGRPVRIASLPTSYGRLLETPDGFTRAGLDVDALRMYIRWRGTTLAALRDAPTAHRDPASIPAERNDPGDGSLAESGEQLLDDAAGTEPGADASAGSGEPGSAGSSPEPSVADSPDPAPSGDRDAPASFADPWGAAKFFAELDGTAYGTTPEDLRDGLEVITEDGRERVWLTPGMPFIVPMFAGLLLALTYGDVLFALLTAVGLV